MKVRPPKLYVIADRGVFRDDDKWLNATKEVAKHLCHIEGSALQIRIKGSGKESRCRRLHEARKVVSEAMDAGLPVLANTTVDQALGLEFSGVHLSERNTPSDPIPTTAIPAGFLMGASTHNAATIQRAARVGVDFVVLAPVFDPVSKSGVGMGLEQFTQLSRQSPVPVLALGGITPSRVSACIQAGADGVAMVSSVMKAPTPTRALDSFNIELMDPANG